VSRPLPNPDEAARRGVEVERHVAALGGYQAAVAALASIDVTIRWDSLRRYVRGERVAPDDILTALDQLATDRPRWLIGRDENRGRWLAHMHKPRFFARVSEGKISAIDWIDEKPAARPHGMLIAEAEAFLA
jgi:hypothetical protein